MSKQLSHDEAAKRDHYCPKCRLIHYGNPPQIYYCVTCGEFGYDCCFDTKGWICNNCEDKTSKSDPDNAVGKPLPGCDNF